jgi:hypothetical protein
VKKQRQALGFHNHDIQPDKQQAERQQRDYKRYNIVVHMILRRLQTSQEKKKIRAIKTAMNNAGPAQGYFSLPDSISFTVICTFHQFFKSRRNRGSER